MSKRLLDCLIKRAAAAPTPGQARRLKLINPHGNNLPTKEPYLHPPIERLPPAPVKPDLMSTPQAPRNSVLERQIEQEMVMNREAGLDDQAINEMAMKKRRTLGTQQDTSGANLEQGAEMLNKQRVADAATQTEAQRKAYIDSITEFQLPSAPKGVPPANLGAQVRRRMSDGMNPSSELGAGNRNVAEATNSADRVVAAEAAEAARAAMQAKAKADNAAAYAVKPTAYPETPKPIATAKPESKPIATVQDNSLATKDNPNLLVDPAAPKQPGLMDRLQGWGGQAVDWAKANPGTAIAGGGAAALLTYLLMNRGGRDEEDDRRDRRHRR